MRFLSMMLAIAAMMVAGLAQATAHEGTPAAGESPLAALGLPELHITASAEGFDVAAEVAAGPTLVTLDNQTEGFAEAQFLQLAEGVTVEQLEEALTAPEIPEFFYSSTWGGGPAGGPGSTTRAVLNLTPGEWVIVNTDAAAGLAPVVVTVTGEAVEATDVAPDATKVEMGAYVFEMPDELPAGPHVWDVSNVHSVPHHIVLLSYPDAVTKEQVMEAFTAEMTGTPPASGIDPSQFQDAGYITLHSQDVTTWVEMDLAPGTYVALCFISDQGSDVPHAAMGMIDVFTVPGEVATPAS